MTTLKGITWDHVRGYGPLEASVEPFFSETGIRVQWDKRSLKDFGDTSLEGLATHYDLIIVDHPHCGTAAKTNALLSLEKIIDKLIIDDLSVNSVGPSFKSYWYNNRLWALPIDAACQVSSFREDLLGDFCLPRHWEEVFILAMTLRSRNSFIGMALCPTDCNCSFLTLCAQQGDGFLEDKIPTETTLRWALSMLRKLQEVAHPDSLQWNPIKLYDYMAASYDVCYCPLAFGYTNYSRDGFAKKKIQFGPIPGHSRALLGGAGIGISNHCKAKPEAIGYAVWLCEERFQTSIYLRSGGQPAHRKAWLDSSANDTTHNFFHNTLPTMEDAYVRPRNMNWPHFQEQLGEIVFQFLKNNLEVSKTCQEIKDCHAKWFGS